MEYQDWMDAQLMGKMDHTRFEMVSVPNEKDRILEDAKRSYELMALTIEALEKERYELLVLVKEVANTLDVDQAWNASERCYDYLDEKRRKNEKIT